MEYLGCFQVNIFWSSDKFDTIFDIFFSIIKFHIRIHPLREQNVGYYQKVIAAIMRRTDGATNNSRIRQQNHRNRKKMNALVIAEDLSMTNRMVYLLILVLGRIKK